MDVASLDPSVWMKQGLLVLSRNNQLRDVLEKAPVSRSVVRRFVAGESTERAVEVSSELHGTGRMATASFGIADTSEGCAALTDLIARADRALYAAKDQGRNRSMIGDGRAA